MRKILLVLAITIISALFVNCNRNKHKQSGLSYLTFKDSIILNVVKTAIHHRALLLNDSVVLYKTSRLIYENHTPKWLFEKTKNKELVNNRPIYSPDVSEIEAPYKLTKHKNSNVFQIIKEKDTINFDFENFDELDYAL